MTNFNRKPYQPHILPNLPESIKQKALEELCENNETRERCLHELRARIEGETDLYLPLPDSYLLLFLRRCKFNTNAAFELITRYFKIKQKYPEIMEMSDYTSVLRMISEQVFSIMPYRDKDGCLIAVQHIINWNTETMPIDLYMHTAFYYLLCMLDSDDATQICGFKFVMDLKDMSWTQVRKLSTRYVWLAAKSLNGHFPLRVKEIHICNEPAVFSYTWAIFRNFLSAKMRNRVHFHSNNMEELHRYVDPALLPEQLEGELKYDSSFVSRTDQVMRACYENQIKYGFRKLS